MKIQRTLLSMLIAGLCAGLLITPAIAKDKKDKSKLEAKAKISQEEAQKIALAKVPNGTVKSAELEKEHGKLVWSFDITTPDSQDITEVLVNAKTGAVVSVEKESAESEAQEKAGESEKEKEEKEDKD